MIPLRHIDRKVGRGEQAAEKQPRAEITADEIGMLALPAEARLFGQRLFHDRRRIERKP